jgi:hypothetical protein
MIEPRDVTDDEVAAYFEQGWVKLDRLFDVDATAAVFAEVQQAMGADAASIDHGAVSRPVLAARMAERHHGHHRLSIDTTTGEVRSSVLHGASHSPKFGDVAARFLGGPVRFLSDAALVKMPVGSGPTGVVPTDWHHHSDPDFDSDHWTPGPTTWAVVWIALRDLPACAGTMRFVGPRSWRDPAVRQLLRDHREDPEPSYAALEALGAISPQIDMRSGDAIVLGPCTYHSAPANRSTDPRWAYLVSVGLASEPYRGGSIAQAMNEGVEGLVVGAPYPEHRFPVLGRSAQEEP